jgi:hypothetical protein
MPPHLHAHEYCPPIPEFFLLGFGVSVKIALKVVALETHAIPENVFIYMGSMVFGCLVAQDVIRLTHDGFKAKNPSSSASAHARIVKRVIWFLRFAVDGLVFAVVYSRSSIGILPFIATLFSLCTIKYLPSAAPFRVRFTHLTTRYCLDFLSRSLFPKTDGDGPVVSHSHDGAHLEKPRPDALDKYNDHEGSAVFRSPLGRRMSTFALSTNSKESPKLNAQTPPSPTSPPRFTPESALAPIPAGSHHGVELYPDAYQSTLAPQASPGITPRSVSAIVFSPVEKPVQASRSARVRALPVVIRPEEGASEMGVYEPAARPVQFSPRNKELGREAAWGQRPAARASGAEDVEVLVDTLSSPSVSSLSPARHVSDRSVIAHTGAAARFDSSGGGAELRQDAASIAWDEAMAQRNSRLQALAASRRGDASRGTVPVRGLSRQLW